MNSNEIVTNLKNSIENTEISAIIVKGDWGIGKTYLVDDAIKKSNCNKRVIRISLFGVSSLKQMRSEIGYQYVSTFASEKGIGHKIQSFARKFTDIVTSVPAVNEYLGSILGDVPSAFVKDCVIVVDDLERKNDNLSIDEIIGEISKLINEQKCKVILIGNVDKLNSERNKYFTHIEKIVDVSIEIVRSIDEILSCVFNESNKLDSESEMFAKKLRITNIRTISRLNIMRKFLFERINEIPHYAKIQCTKTLLLALHLRYNQPENLPSISELRNWKGNWGKNDNEAQKKMSKELELVGYGETDEFDKLVIDYVNEGMIDIARFNKVISKISFGLEKNKAQEALVSAYETFNGSFKCTEENIFNAMMCVIMEHGKYIRIKDLNVIYQLFKYDLHSELYANQIKAQIQICVESKGDKINGEINYTEKSMIDNDIWDLIESKICVPENRIDLFREIIPRMYRTNGWHPSDTIALRESKPEEIAKYLLNANKDEIDQVMNVYNMFRNLGGISTEDQEIPKRLDEAMGIVANSSELNRIRIDQVWKRRTA